MERLDFEFHKRKIMRIPMYYAFKQYRPESFFTEIDDVQLLKMYFEYERPCTKPAIEYVVANLRFSMLFLPRKTFYRLKVFLKR